MDHSSDVLSRVKSFLPDFKKETDKLLKDESFRKEKQMDIKINEDLEGEHIEMNIGVGLFDVNGDEEQLKKLDKKFDELPRSTEKIIKLKEVTSDSSEEDSDESEKV